MGCLLEGCTEPSKARGLCTSHYWRAWADKTLDTVAPKIHGKCDQCGDQIPADRQYGAIFCSRKCKDIADLERRHQRVVERRAARRTLCEHCGTVMVGAPANKRFCSKRCTRLVHRGGALHSAS